MTNALATLRKDLAKDLARASKTLPPSGGRTISMKGKVFTLPNSAVVKAPLECIILDYRNVNRWFEKPYNPSNPVPPDCFAINREADKLEPHGGAPKPQAPSCESCSKNEWGSTPTGGKACRNGVRLAVVPLDATEKSPIWEIFVPPTSLKHWTKYAAGLIAAGKLPVQVRSAIAFNPDVDYPQPKFGAGEALPDGVLEVMLGLRARAQEALDAPMVKKED